MIPKKVPEKSGEGIGNPFQYFHLENHITEEPDGLQSMVSQKARHD